MFLRHCHHEILSKIYHYVTNAAATPTLLLISCFPNRDVFFLLFTDYLDFMDDVLTELSLKQAAPTQRCELFYCKQLHFQKQINARNNISFNFETSGLKINVDFFFT